MTTTAHAAHHARFRAAATSAAADRIPAGIGRACISALVGAVMLLAVLECTWRHLRIYPQVEDDQRLWASTRDRMRPDDPSQIVLSGTSRMLQDIDIHELSRGMDGAPVAQLAINGSAGLLVFDALSRDVHFRGLALLDVVPYNMYGDMKLHDETSVDFLNYYAHRPWIAHVEERLRTAFQLTFAFRRVNCLSLLDDLHRRRLPHPTAYRVDTDRGCGIDWSLARTWQYIDVERLHADPGDYASPPRLRENLATLEVMIRRIEARGGRVALVWLPVSGLVAKYDDMSAPREQYWDVLAATTSAVTFTWLDDPRMQKFKCPDGSHLDVRDQAEFTRLLTEDLRDKLKKRSSSGAGNPNFAVR